jgi:RND superfamily putative drug exporter
MNGIAKFISGKATAPLTMLLALFFAVLAFGPLTLEEESVSPGIGLPKDNQTVLVDEALKGLPGQDVTAAVLIYRTEDGSKLTDAQLTYLRGEEVPVVCPPFIPPFGCADYIAEQGVSYDNGVNEKFLEFSSAEIEGEKFVPPAVLSEDGAAAVVTIPLTKSDATEVITERVKEMRAVMNEDLPSGLVAKLTGAEGFQADIAGVFAGANFVLLGVTALVVILLLLITYRSPILWLIPLLIIGTADRMASILAGQVAKFLDITLDGSVTGILSVLVFGAGTNYALLIISRYREELLLHENRRDAMVKAWREAAPAIFASGSTVVLALLTLILATLEGTRSLGIASAVGIVIAMISALFVLPAALVIFGRWIFWPVAPKLGGVNKTDNGLWAKLGRGVSKKPLVVAIAGFAVLGILASGATGVKIGLASTEQFTVKPEAVIGLELLDESFPGGQTSPTVVIAENKHVDHVVEAIKEIDGVDEVSVAKEQSGEVISDGSVTKIDVVLAGTSRSDEAFETIVLIREAVADIDGTLVGGQDAQALDQKNAYAVDQGLLIPLILLLVFLVLVLLLRSLVAPILLLLTVVASFFASIGAGWLVFTQLLGFPALDLSVFLYSFLFLVALGVDFNIFLVTRAQEESQKVGLKQGMIKALSSTGGVITSAGILLAAVFAVLGVLPLIALTQIGVIVGIGVLLDTLLVRTVIVPALAFMAGEKFWWPRKPAK